MKCLNPECASDAKARGLCNACFGAAAYYIRKGVMTWEQLEKEGKAVPMKKGPRTSTGRWLLSGGKGGAE